MRIGEIYRTTSETDIKLRLDLDGGDIKIDTGIGFFDHMLTAFAKHSGMGLQITAKGDLQVDCHHTVEDTGIVLGQAIAKALGDKSGIARYGSAFIPMDEALGFCSLDISNRPYLVFDAKLNEQKVGDFDSCMCVEFMRAVAFNAGITLHLKCEYGLNTHHVIEALFKAFAHAFKDAIKPIDGVLSTKGAL